jgi:hypothetical protein
MSELHKLDYRGKRARLMETKALAIPAEVMSSLILRGDISGLNSEQRVQYVSALCERIGLDPLTQPFKILKLQGKEMLYADKGCGQQLCKIYNISTEVTKKEKVEDVYVVTVRAKLGDRFTDEDGAVTIGNLKGDMLANALMKAVTKAKRRAVLAIVGLGMLDETEIDTIPNATTKTVEISVQGDVTSGITQPKQENATKSVLEPITAVLQASVTPKDDIEHPSLSKISEKEGMDLLKMAIKNGYTKQEVKDYIVGLGYKTHRDLNEWDLKTVEVRFREPKEKWEKERKDLQKDEEAVEVVKKKFGSKHTSNTVDDGIPWEE